MLSMVVLPLACGVRIKTGSPTHSPLLGPNPSGKEPTPMCFMYFTDFQGLLLMRQALF